MKVSSNNGKEEIKAVNKIFICLKCGIALIGFKKRKYLSTTIVERSSSKNH